MTARRKPPDAAGPGGSAEVVSITARTGGRAGFRRVVSARIASERAALGMTCAEFADHLAALLGWRPSPSTVERWEQAGIAPAEVYVALGATPGPGQDEIRPYAGRGLIGREQWNGIINGATEHLWLYGMAEFGYATDDEVPAILENAAGSGCAVRVLLLDPDSPAAATVDADEGSPAGTLSARIRASLARFSAMRRDCPAIRIRAYDTQPTVSIVRGDGLMLVTPYLRYFLGSNSPTFEFSADSAPGMFGRYERHFETMWDNSRERD